MTRNILRPLSVVVASCAMAAGAFAQAPNPAFSSLQSTFIDVAGWTACPAGRCVDPRNSFLVTVYFGPASPLIGSRVWIDFSGCPDIQISCDQLTPETQQAYLASKTVQGFTDNAGEFVFKAQGAANAVLMPANMVSPGTNVGVACAQIWAGSVPAGSFPDVLLGNLIVAAYDINGLGSPTGAVNGVDVSLVASEVAKSALGAGARAREDYNHSGSLNGADVSKLASMAAAAGLGTGTQVTAPFCP